MIFQDGRHSISIIFSKILFNAAIGMSTVTLFTKGHVNNLSITIAMTFEIFDRNPTSAIFRMAAVPANFNFQIRSISENVLHDIYNY